MQLVQGGNPRAFELLYDRHGGAAFSLAYRMVGNKVTAEDITQEAFLSIWRSRLRYDQARGSVRTWVLGIVHNRAIDALRRGTVHDRRRETLDGVEERHEAKERTDVEAARREEARERPQRSRHASRGAAPDDRARLLRRLQPQPDRGHARHAARHRQGPHAARPREDAPSAGGGLHPGGAGVTGPDHARFREDTAAFLLGALTDGEQRAFELHMEQCPECRDEVERLRPAADALPRSVEQIPAPDRLKSALMDVVESEAREDPAQPARRRRLRDLLPGPRAAAGARRRPARARPAGRLRGRPAEHGRGSAHDRRQGGRHAGCRWPAPSSASRARATTARC